MTFFRKKCTFSRRKILMNLLSRPNQPYFLCSFLSLWCICCLKSNNLIYTIIYGSFFTRKSSISEKQNSFLTPFFYCVRTLAHIHSNKTTSPNIKGTNTWAVPHVKFGGLSPSPPKSLPMCHCLLNYCCAFGILFSNNAARFIYVL